MISLWLEKYCVCALHLLSSLGKRTTLLYVFHTVSLLNFADIDMSFHAGTKDRSQKYHPTVKWALPLRLTPATKGTTEIRSVQVMPPMTLEPNVSGWSDGITTEFLSFWHTCFITQEALLSGQRAERGRARERKEKGSDSRMIEWEGREWGGRNDVKMENDNIIWFDLWARMDSQCPFSEGGAGDRWRRREECDQYRPQSSFSNGTLRWLDSCWWRH